MILKNLNVTQANRAAHNTGFASGGVTCKLEALYFYSSSVQVDSFVLRNQPERKAQKRYVQTVATETKINDFLVQLYNDN